MEGERNDRKYVSALQLIESLQIVEERLLVADEKVELEMVVHTLF